MHMLLYNYGAEISPKFFGREFLEGILSVVDDAVSQLTGKCDDRIIEKLKFIRLVPLRMLIVNAKTYYKNIDERTNLAKKFCDVCDYYKIDLVSEGSGTGGIITETDVEYGMSVNVIKKQYNL